MGRVPWTLLRIDGSSEVVPGVQPAAGAASAAAALEAELIAGSDPVVTLDAAESEAYVEPSVRRSVPVAWRGRSSIAVERGTAELDAG